MALFKPIIGTPDLPPKGTSRESGTFDFKETQDPTDQRELAKDVAAFANALGGVLLVGAVEDKKRATLGVYKPIPKLEDAEALRKAYELAVTQRCVPKPVVDVVRIETGPPDYPAGHVVAVNVYASPAAPIGVRWDDDGVDIYAFPLRTTTHTHFMPPTELAMLMVPEIRRIAITLDSIPPNERANVRFLFRLPNVKYDLDATFVEIDRTLTTVTMKAPPGKLGPKETTVEMPLDRIETIWRRAPGAWTVLINGTVFENRGVYEFSSAL